MNNDDFFSRQENIGIPKSRFSQAVLVIGLSGVAFEIAKALRFLGPFRKIVAAYVDQDDGPISTTHIAVNIHYGNEVLEGPKPLSHHFLTQIRDLAPYGQDAIEAVALSKDFLYDVSAQSAFLAKHGIQLAFVSCESVAMSDLFLLDQTCRNADIGFFAAEVRGTLGRFFIDFTPNKETYQKSEIVDSNCFRVLEAKEPNILVLGEFEIPHDGEVYLQLAGADGNWLCEPALLQPDYETDTSSLPRESMPVTVPPKLFGIVKEAFTEEQVVFAYILPKVVRPEHKSLAEVFTLVDPAVKGLLMRPNLAEFAKSKLINIRRTHTACNAVASYVSQYSKYPITSCSKEFLKVVSKQDAADPWFSKVPLAIAAPNYAVNSFFAGLIGIEIVRFLADKPPNLLENPAHNHDIFRQYCAYDFTELLFPGKALPIELKSALGNLNVLIVGAGALGVEITKNLVPMGGGSGNGRLTVIDYDTIDISNLVRQFTYSIEDAKNNTKKATALANYVHKRYPKVRYVGEDGLVGGLGHPALSDADIILAATDNLASRTMLEIHATIKKVPYINAATNVFFAQGNTSLAGVVQHNIPAVAITLGRKVNCFKPELQTRREVAEQTITMVQDILERCTSAQEFLMELWPQFLARDEKLRSLNEQKYVIYCQLLEKSARYPKDICDGTLQTPAEVLCHLVSECLAVKTGGYDKDLKPHMDFANALAIMNGLVHLGATDVDYVNLLRLASGMMVSVLSPSVLAASISCLNIMSVALARHRKETLQAHHLIHFDNGVMALPFPASSKWEGTFPILELDSQTNAGAMSLSKLVADRCLSDSTLMTKCSLVVDDIDLIGPDDEGPAFVQMPPQLLCIDYCYTDISHDTMLSTLTHLERKIVDGTWVLIKQSFQKVEKRVITMRGRNAGMLLGQVDELADDGVVTSVQWVTSSEMISVHIPVFYGQSLSLVLGRKGGNLKRQFRSCFGLKGEI